MIDVNNCINESQEKMDMAIMSLWILTAKAKSQIGKLICLTFRMMSSRSKMAYNGKAYTKAGLL